MMESLPEMPMTTSLVGMPASTISFLRKTATAARSAGSMRWEMRAARS